MVNARIAISRILTVVGIAGMVLGLLDPLEGWPIIFLGVTLAALGAAIGKSRRRALNFIAVALVGFGAGAMVVLSLAGGIGGNARLSIWWGLFILPYPVGWLVGLVSAAWSLVDSWKGIPRLNVGMASKRGS